MKNSNPKRLTVQQKIGRTTSIGVMASTAILLSLLSPAWGSTQHKTKTKKTAPVATTPPITENDRIVHVLNRLGFGPRPEDFVKVKQMGLYNYIEQQLYPEKIDDTVVDQKLQTFTELMMSDQDIEDRYRDFITTDQSMNKLRGELRKIVAQREAQTQMANAAPAQPMTDTMMNQAGGAAMTAGMPATPKPGNKQAEVRAMVAADPDLQKQVNEMQDALQKVAQPIGLLHEEFTAAKLLRATESQRQLQEVLVDFWSNHFNIDIRKAPCGVLKVLDDRDVIRPHIFGKFRDLLEASAKSPAMLVYLDNFQSVSDTLPQPAANRRARLAQFSAQAGVSGTQVPAVKPIQPKRKVGLNENYAREIMELHTLGVDGGYTQQDVHEVARCFTGWGIGAPGVFRAANFRYDQAGEFQFHPRVHDDGEKVVLGHTIPAGGGMQDGETVLDILASNPATMRHISYQLCQRLVCDEPPMSLVNKCVATWKRTDGDLREVTRTIITSPEFFSPIAMRKKIKSPYEYAISSVRALGGTLDPNALVPRPPSEAEFPRLAVAAQRQTAREANLLVRPPQGGAFLDVNTNTLLGQITTMGEPLFQYLAPTGFPEDSRKWVSSGALISRLNFSLALTQGKLKDVKLQDPSEDAGGVQDPNAVIDRLSTQILHGEISPSTRTTLISEAKASPDAMGAKPMSPATIAALLLGSPEFQRR